MITFLLFIVYILPPLINFYRKAFSVAELLAYGYVTFLRNGVPTPPQFDIARYTNSAPCSYFVS
jgi:hypothetical protein